jgi:hypothetical protein
MHRGPGVEVSSSQQLASHSHHAKRFVPGEIWSAQGATRPALNATSKIGTRCQCHPPAPRIVVRPPPRAGLGEVMTSIKPKL